MDHTVVGIFRIVDSVDTIDSVDRLVVLTVHLYASIYVRISISKLANDYNNPYELHLASLHSFV